jgi:hypothetical protein
VGDRRSTTVGREGLRELLVEVVEQDAQRRFRFDRLPARVPDDVDPAGSLPGHLRLTEGFHHVSWRSSESRPTVVAAVAVKFVGALL